VPITIFNKERVNCMVVEPSPVQKLSLNTCKIGLRETGKIQCFLITLQYFWHTCHNVQDDTSKHGFCTVQYLETRNLCIGILIQRNKITGKSLPANFTCCFVKRRDVALFMTVIFSRTVYFE